MSSQPNIHRFNPQRNPPKPPRHLSASTRHWWTEVVASYDLESHHLRILQAACEAWERMVQARDILAKDGLTFVSKAGEIKRHPAVQIEQDSRIAFLRAVRELALDVSAPDDSRPPAITGRPR